MMNIVIFASGNGSNFQAIYSAVQNGELEANISLLVCDKPNAKVVERAKAAGIPTFVISLGDFSNKDEFEMVIYEQLLKYEVQYIVLAGYMRLIGPCLLEKFDNKIINIHPSLLPSFPGKDAIGQAIEARVKVTGVTIHFVDKGMDTGPIIAQETIMISDGDTEETLAPLIHQVEHDFYPKTLQKLFQQVETNKNL